jgi:polar amino acid transport system permease protein
LSIFVGAGDPGMSIKIISKDSQVLLPREQQGERLVGPASSESRRIKRDLFYGGLLLLFGVLALFNKFELVGWIGILYKLMLGITLVVGNWFIVRQIPFRFAVVIVWVELAFLFVLFCSSFDFEPMYALQKTKSILGLELRDGFLQGAALTIFICATSIALAMVLALLAALAKLFGDGFSYGIASFYISFFRGTPLLLQILIIYLGLPQAGWTIPAVPAGILALALNYGAYMAEIFRGGITAIPRGQWEAADALALRKMQVLRWIVLPQSLRLIVPATGNQFIMMLKDSALVSAMGVWEMMYLARAIGRADFRNMEMLITAALIYWIMSAILEGCQARLELRYSRGIRSSVPTRTGGK